MRVSRPDGPREPTCANLQPSSVVAEEASPLVWFISVWCRIGNPQTHGYPPFCRRVGRTRRAPSHLEISNPYYVDQAKCMGSPYGRTYSGTPLPHAGL